MITWMQRHKRWLVITIWISTIAFVGAGFVGWGSYDYGKDGGTVAVVADREVSVEEYQQEYSSLYDQYARLFGETFNKDMADKLNLKDVAYKQVIQKNLILSYADSLGLDVTDQDIAKELLKYNAFMVDGKFDKATYVKVLSQNRTTPVKFEDSLKRNILLQKVQLLFDIKPNSVEVENLSKLLFIEDDISYKILNIKDITVNPTEDDLKKHWEANKNAYMSEVSYVFERVDVPVVSSNSSAEDIEKHHSKFKTDYKKEDGKIKSFDEAKAEVIKELDNKFTKKEALKKYLKVKKAEETLTASTTIDESKLPFSTLNNQKIIDSKPGDLLKPFLEDDKFVIVRVLAKNESKPLSYEKALEDVKVSYEKVAKAKKLDELAQKELENFVGTEVKGITRQSIAKIAGLEPQEAADFLSRLFVATEKTGTIKVNDKVVLFRIDNSKFGTYDKARDESIKSTIVQLQSEELMNNLVKRLENKYEIQSSIEIKE
ncbi:peptidylprolyl isomerase [Poseidonibacter ostreae]|jgi:peptidyl-prolyl cis-trans isomerase D|uniref:Peptidylprolyl isomerase n=1 Tax=Poseidonibacter ostreae TaxID=2654171 RepID=A0A6L4WSU4_9BACT|nr:peptidylprolyl isomerase [Poseidonibacter ostreae]KAB7886229.1 peptidylprolyl isomerase [Poseidonibacter ostreae]KAB7886932.1 peptidylprolyl isomerase [Poseidonibacter ostreae]KAB7892225.1 peptidylprolyl isomerase [Poseidonibacter ostreae]